MELDGTIIGKFGKAGKALGEFATIHQMDCRNPTSSTPPRSTTGGHRKLFSSRTP
jgi:hypothetical protein